MIDTQQTVQTVQTVQADDSKLDNSPKVNKDVESEKGYWTDDEPRGLAICVDATTKGMDVNSRISLSSDYWYRVQHFNLGQSTTDEAWKVINAVAKECARTLVLHSAANKSSSGSEPGNNEEECSKEVKDCDLSTPAVHYCIPSLSVKHVDQIYYLIKHALTKAKMKFTISHGFRFDTSKGVTAPPKRRRRRKKKNTQ